MAVDVLVETTIQAPVAKVAAYASDPTQAPSWYENIKRAEWVTQPPLQVGSRFSFTAQFLGRTLTYTYEAVEHEPERKLVMRTSEGPFPMETTYTWTALGSAATRMTLRNRGDPRGFGRLLAPFMAKAMRHAMAKDLARIKGILETRPSHAA